MVRLHFRVLICYSCLRFVLLCFCYFGLLIFKAEYRIVVVRSVAIDAFWTIRDIFTTFASWCWWEAQALLRFNFLLGGFILCPIDVVKDFVEITEAFT